MARESPSSAVFSFIFVSCVPLFCNSSNQLILPKAAVWTICMYMNYGSQNLNQKNSPKLLFYAYCYLIQQKAAYNFLLSVSCAIIRAAIIYSLKLQSNFLPAGCPSQLILHVLPQKFIFPKKLSPPFLLVCMYIYIYILYKKT